MHVHKVPLSNDLNMNMKNINSKTWTWKGLETSNLSGICIYIQVTSHMFKSLDKDYIDNSWHMYPWCNPLWTLSLKSLNFVSPFVPLWINSWVLRIKSLLTWLPFAINHYYMAYNTNSKNSNSKYNSKH